MAVILQLTEAIRQFVRDGDIVACEGFTHLIPFAAGHEIIRQQRRNLTVTRMTPDVMMYGRQEFGPRYVRVSLVEPGATQTLGSGDTRGLR